MTRAPQPWQPTSAPLSGDQTAPGQHAVLDPVYAEIEAGNPTISHEDLLRAMAQQSEPTVEPASAAVTTPRAADDLRPGRQRAERRRSRAEQQQTHRESVRRTSAAANAAASANKERLAAEKRAAKTTKERT